VGQGDHAIDVVEPVKPAHAVEVVGDIARHGGRAVHRGDDPDIVAGADAARTAVVTHEAAAVVWGQHPCRLGLDRELVPRAAFRHGKIVQVDVIARRDVLGGNADHLTELAQGRARGDRPHRHLVPARDQLVRGQARQPRRFAPGDAAAGDCDIIGRVEKKRGGDFVKRHGGGPVSFDADRGAGRGGPVKRNPCASGRTSLVPAWSIA
jgi:hypothetical protein